MGEENNQEVVEQDQVEEPEVEETELETGEEEVTPTTDEEIPKTVPVKAVVEERKKRQEAEAKLKELEERQTAQPVQQANKSVYDYYDENPDGLMSYIDAEIKRMAEEDPWGNAAAIEELRSNKLDLKLYGMNRQQELATTFRSTIQKDIPKLNEVAKYAVAELGYTPEEIKGLSQPSRSKAEADMKLKILKTINRAYERENAGKTLQSKEVRKDPTRVETPGSGVPASAPKLQKLYEDAKRSGNWTAYLEAAGI